MCPRGGFVLNRSFLPAGKTGLAGKTAFLTLGLNTREPTLKTSCLPAGRVLPAGYAAESMSSNPGCVSWVWLQGQPPGRHRRAPRLPSGGRRCSQVFQSARAAIRTDRERGVSFCISGSLPVSASAFMCSMTSPSIEPSWSSSMASIAASTGSAAAAARAASGS